MFWILYLLLLTKYPRSLAPSQLSWSRGKELDCRSLGRGFEPWPISGTPVITHRSCPDDWLAQFSLTHMHKGGMKQYSLHFHFLFMVHASHFFISQLMPYWTWQRATLVKKTLILDDIKRMCVALIYIILQYIGAIVESVNRWPSSWSSKWAPFYEWSWLTKDTVFTMVSQQ